MAKYSTGSGGGGAGESCELCGADGVDLEETTVAGATIHVCGDCAQHGDAGHRSDDGGGRHADDGDRDRKRQAARNTARIHDAAKGDASHWEEGADYDDDQLPYLVTDYGTRVTEARQEAGLQPQELADELDVDEADVIAVEQGRATKAGVGGSLIAALEDRLDVELAEDA